MSASTLAEHTDALLYLMLILIGALGYMMKRWDKSHIDRDMEHAEAMKSVVKDVKSLSTQLNMLSKDFYELRGEHNAHHRRRMGDQAYDDLGFKNTHIHERRLIEGE